MSLRQAVFRAWFRMSRPMTLGVRVIVENEKGEVLLVRHTYVEGLLLPGGGVERGEPSEEALVRELVEEAGVEMVEPQKLLGIFFKSLRFRQ